MYRVADLFNKNPLERQNPWDWAFEDALAPRVPGVAPAARARFREPAITMLSYPKTFVVWAELPGVSKSTLELSHFKNVLTIRATATDPVSAKSADAQVVSAEMNGARFLRQITFPERIEFSKLKSRLQNGLLEVTVPKQITKPVKQNRS